MIDIIETANRIASSGVVVRLYVSAWSGFLPPRPEWGNRYLCTIPEEAKHSVGLIKRQIRDAFFYKSIQCHSGRFIPNRIIPEWIREHEEIKAKLAAIVEIMANSVNTLRDAARLAAGSQSVKVWAENHPTEGTPPLSMSSHASSIVDSIMPSKDDIMAKFYTAREINTHSFLVTQTIKFLNDGEKRRSAWNAIDELVAGNIRKLIERLEYAATRKDGRQRRFERATKTVISFRNTDLVPELGLSSYTDELYDMINNKAACEVDDQKLLLSIANLINRSKEMSTVSSIVKRLNA